MTLATMTAKAPTAIDKMQKLVRDPARLRESLEECSASDLQRIVVALESVRLRVHARIEVLTARRFERWLSVIPARMIPRRVQTEVMGDGIERICAVVLAGESKWKLRLVHLSVFLVVLAEIVRYWARAIKGQKAR